MPHGEYPNAVGTTSACAENTGKRIGARRRTCELPPRARRILVTCAIFSLLNGTTSACAENTQHRDHEGCSLWNYLRVRGEYTLKNDRQKNYTELPPRARRIPSTEIMRAAASGTTSACAENTGIIRVAVSPRRNYLRVRGEYSTGITGVRWVPELPPRARRILLPASSWLPTCGTTSACAENTGGIR